MLRAPSSDTTTALSLWSQAHIPTTAARRINEIYSFQSCPHLGMLALRDNNQATSPSKTILRLHCPLTAIDWTQHPEHSRFSGWEVYYCTAAMERRDVSAYRSPVRGVGLTHTTNNYFNILRWETVRDHIAHPQSQTREPHERLSERTSGKCRTIKSSDITSCCPHLVEQRVEDP